MTDPLVDIDACRGRQKRLLQVMAESRIDLCIAVMPEHIQWLAGPRFGPLLASIAALSAEGHLTLVCPDRQPEVVAADEILVYQAKWHSTMRNDQMPAAAATLLKLIKGRPGPNRLGVEFSAFGPHLSSEFSATLVDIEPDLYRLRRRKDEDELAKLTRAIAGTGKMYERAREIIRPGVSELEVFNELQSAAVDSFGEMLTGTGNDYQCCSRGGPPRPRQCAAGQLYILDLGPAYRGYFADNARTIAVTEPNQQQQKAWEYVMRAMRHVEETAKPGKSAKALFQEVEAILQESPVGVFDHHLGHGIGLFPHEAPHLNPNWDDTFEVDEVFTAEPGLYDQQQLLAGMRIENDYLVTETGVELLSPFPLEL